MTGPDASWVRPAAAHAVPVPITPFTRRPARTGTVLLATVGLLVLGLLLLLLFAYLAVSLGLAAVVICGILALLPLAGVLATIGWIDRWEPEPLAAKAFALLWGAAAAVTIALLIDLGAQLTSALSGAPPESEFVAAVIRAPIVEESAKGVGVLILFYAVRRTFDGPIDGIVYAATIAAGFAFVENILYFGGALAEGGGAGLAGTFFLRGMLSPFAHVMFTSCTGAALGFAARRGAALGPVLFLAGLVPAIALHALWNAASYIAPSFLGFYVVIEVPLFVMACILVVVLRRREEALTRARLGDYAAAGWFTADEVRMLATAAGRRHAMRWARLKGFQAPAIMRGFVRDATRLALVRQRILSGHGAAGAREDEAELLRSTVADRAALVALG